MFRRLFFTLSLLFSCTIAAAAAPIPRVNAQISSIPTFSTLEIGLWPEYDQPSMLVIYTITLADDTVYPAEIHLRIPTAAGTPSAIATGPSVENLFSVDYARTEEGQWSMISIKTYVPVVRLEFYDPALVLEGSLRRYQFNWLAMNDIEHVYLQVQQPYEGEDLVIVPSPQQGTWISDGVLNYYNADVGAYQASQPLVLTVQYRKETPLLSVTGLQVKPTSPIDIRTPGRATIWSSIPWILLIPLVVITLLVAATWYWRIDLTDTVIPSMRRFHGKKVDEGLPDEDMEPSTNAQGVHCHQCGRRAIAGDRFCRSCGTLLKME